MKNSNKIILLVLIITSFTACVTSKQSESIKFANSKFPKAIAISKALHKNHDKINSIIIYDYTDSIFPNDDLLKFNNLSKLQVYGHISLYKANPSARPIKLRFDTLKIKQLKNLKYIRLHDFDFEEFPEGLLRLNELKVLCIINSGIKYLPNNINKLCNLEILELRLNNINSLPSSIKLMDSLKVLDIANNDFRVIPQILYDVTNLQYIVLSNPEGPAYLPLKKSTGIYFGNTNNVINYRDENNNLNKIFENPQIKRIYISVANCDEQIFVKSKYSNVLSKIYIERRETESNILICP